MRVDYQLGFNNYVSEWICLEHTGYARQKAELWWNARSNDSVPADADEAVELAESGALAPTLSITVERKPSDKYDRVVAHQLGPRPPRLESPEDLPEYVYVDDASVPF
jgi:DNA repair protein RadD